MEVNILKFRRNINDLGHVFTYVRKCKVSMGKLICEIAFMYIFHFYSRHKRLSATVTYILHCHLIVVLNYIKHKQTCTICNNISRCCCIKTLFQSLTHHASITYTVYVFTVRIFPNLPSY